MERDLKMGPPSSQGHEQCCGWHTGPQFQHLYNGGGEWTKQAGSKTPGLRPACKHPKAWPACHSLPSARTLLRSSWGERPSMPGVSQGVDSLVTFPRKGSKERVFRELEFHFPLSKTKPSSSLTCDVSSNTALGVGGNVSHLGQLF